MNEEIRYCDRFNMSAQEFQDYKSSKYTRIFLYLLVMVFVTIFNDRWTGYIFLTGWLLISYWHNAKQEQQWIKDGSMRREDL